MSDLVTQFGTDWFNRKFAGTIFNYKGVSCRVQMATTKGKVLCRAVRRVDNKLVAADLSLPTSEFKSAERFRTRELGYRTAQNGKYLAFLRRNNSSYSRGVSVKDIHLLESPLTSALVDGGHIAANLSEDELHLLVAHPTYLPLGTGLKLLLQGKVASFAVSPTVAVMPAPDSDKMLLLFCGKFAGHVEPDGTLSLQVRLPPNLGLSL